MPSVTAARISQQPRLRLTQSGARRWDRRWAREMRRRRSEWWCDGPPFTEESGEAYYPFGNSREWHS
eukprot:896891-Rhodomonas_salina.1